MMNHYQEAGNKHQNQEEPVERISFIFSFLRPSDLSLCINENISLLLLYSEAFLKNRFFKSDILTIMKFIVRLHQK